MIHIRYSIYAYNTEGIFFSPDLTVKSNVKSGPKANLSRECKMPH